MHYKKNMLTSAVMAALAATTGSVTAQAENSFMLEEVVVTAQKRAESVQDIPIAVSAFDADFLKESNIVGVDKLVSFTPGLNGTAQRDTSSVFTMRGIGTYAFGAGVDNSVGMYIDDVPVSRTSLIGNSFFDLQRVEVVKGPQGTLFGRNSSAGAISLITNKPSVDENSLDATVGVGNENQRVYEILGNLALSDTLAVRAAVRHDERDGSFENVATGDELNNRDHTNARLSVRYLASDSVTADFSVESVAIDTRTGTVLLSEVFRDEVSQDKLPSQDIESQRYLAKVSWDINDNITLTSNTSYLNYDMIGTPVDVDVSDTFVLNLIEPEEGDQLMQEFRLNGSSGDLDWFAGASYIDERVENHTTYQFNDFELAELLSPGLGSVLCGAFTCLDFVEQAHDAETNNTSYALYGDLAWNINDKLKLTVGARYTRDKKEFEANQSITNSALSQLIGDAVIFVGTDGPVKDEESWASFDPRIALDYQLAEEVLIYGSVSSGYKSGGFNSDVANTLASGLPQQLVSFDEEQVLAYEIGVKSRFWDGRAQLNASVYFNDYEDFQLETSSLSGIFIQNAGNVESKGFEVEGVFMATENLTLMANYSYLNAEFQKGTFIGDVDVAGQSLQRAPQHSGGLVASYVMPVGDLGELSLRADYLYSDEFLFATDEPTEKSDAYSVVNARIGFRAASDRWELALIGENITDEEYLVHMTSPLGAPLAIPSMRSLYRLEATVHF